MPSSSTTVSPGRGDARRAGRWPAPGRPWAYPLALAVAVVVVGLVLRHYAFTIWSHTLDDDVYRVTGRFAYADFPSSLWSTTADQRGLQRLQSWLLGFGPGIFGSPGGFRVVRIVDLVAYLSTVIPVWRWLRALGVHPAVAAGGALLAIVTPWAVVTSTFMTESLAYPLAAWALYLSWKAAVQPTLGSLVKAGALIGVASLARSVMLLLGPVLVLAMLAVGASRARAAWASRSTWTPRQILPWALVGGAVLIVLVLYAVDRSALDPLTGVYGASVTGNWGALPRLVRWDLAYVVSGIGVLPGIVALAWIGKSLVRPARAESLALAVIAAAMAVVVAYSTMRAGPDERYMMYLAIPLVVAAAAAVGRREIGPIGLIAGTAVTLWLFSGVPWRGDAASFQYYIFAAQVFHGKILLLNLGSHLPDVGFSYALILALAIAAAMALAVFALRRGGTPARVLAVAFALGLAVLQLGQMTYVDKHFSAEANYGPAQLAGHAWVDETVGGDATVGVFASRTGPDISQRDLYDTWREVAFFNNFKRTIFQVDGSVGLDPLYGESKQIKIDVVTGRLHADVPIPRLMLQYEITPRTPLYGKTIKYAGYVPYSLVRLQGAPRLKWFVGGGDDASWTLPKTKMLLRVYKDAGTGSCVTLIFQPPPGMTKDRPITVTADGRTYRTSVAPQGQAKIAGIRLGGGDAYAFGDVSIAATGSTPYLGAPRGVRVASIERGACA
ncbi:MAG: hypothetical protein JWR63_1762 [Conexibacter sp.]|nr:hypothetical protein [Conexibacter sp.]